MATTGQADDLIITATTGQPDDLITMAATGQPDQQGSGTQKMRKKILVAPLREAKSVLNVLGGGCGGGGWN